MTIATPPARPPRRSLPAQLGHELTRTPLRRRVFLVVGILVLAALAVPLVINAGLQLLAETAGSPAPRTFAADSVVVDRAGVPIADLHPPGETRIPIPLSAVAPAMQKAIVDVEDRHFWTEGAVDVGRVAGAALHDANGGSQGASTIPMQLVKLVYLNDNRTVSFKLQEIGLAQRLAESTPKPAILDDYLNDVFFGGGATGVQAAAHRYFGVDAASLSLAQSALLAGLPNAPSANDPLVNPDAAKARQLQVLEAMVTSGDLSAADASAASQEPLRYAPFDIDDVDQAPAFVARAAQQVASALNVDPTTAG
ncbi:MAG: transglycosylase domain-containing protein, partial [Candidatus Dormibacteraeota bacterium]|nr:transglycosylase domain-containing protein [Candidatus Dormibacteraeota bacterium]